MKKVLLLSIALIFASNIYAQQQVSAMEARNAAIHTLCSKSEVLKISDNARVEAIHDFHNGRGDTLMYEVVFQNNMGVLLSGSKASLPVLAYYTKPKHDTGSIFDANNENVPCCLRELLREYAQEIDSCFAKNSKTLHYATQWQALQDTIPSKISKHGTVIVEPLLKTIWSQTYATGGCCDAFNYYVEDTHKKCTSCTSGRCPVGCTATAMAQIMKHWNYPVYVPNKVQQYDWCNMPDTLYCYSNPRYEKERDAIARLMKDCGDAAKSNYCSGGCSSSSTVYKARQGFVNDLGYSSDADHQWKTSYHINTWKGRIKNNLNHGWPVLYGGYDPSPPAGHSFVLDGYTDDDYFHVNWGWGTGYNDYFTLNDLTLSGSTFSTQSACFYIYPDVNQDYCNFSWPLSFHYNYWTNIMGFPVTTAHLLVPKTFTVLESVPAGNQTPASWHTIVAGQSAEYVAHERIILQPGFKVEAGGHFIARIEPCPDCGNRSRSSLLDNQGEDELSNEDFNDVVNPRSHSVQQTIPSAESVVKVFPNPADNVLTVQFSEIPEGAATLQLFDLMGRCVLAQSLFGEQNTVSIGSLSQGMYYYRVICNGEIVARNKVVKK